MGQTLPIGFVMIVKMDILQTLLTISGAKGSQCAQQESMCLSIRLYRTIVYVQLAMLVSIVSIRTFILAVSSASAVPGGTYHVPAVQQWTGIAPNVRHRRSHLTTVLRHVPNGLSAGQVDTFPRMALALATECANCVTLDTSVHLLTKINACYGGLAPWENTCT